MASYQASLPPSQATAATPSGSAAKASNPSGALRYPASASQGKASLDYQHSYPSPSIAHQNAKLPAPGLAECPEREIDTFIGCPIVVLLQHKDFCAVKLQAIEEGTHAIKCRNCPFQTSEPIVMLTHLAKLHKRYTDTQYLCQLTNTFMGQKPVCFGVTGYDELPDGLSDFLDGVFRWDKRTQSSVIVFPCRLCPTCYLTKSDLKTHYLSHQQALLSVNKSDGNQAMYMCRICRQEFQDFISYYDHHMWMRLADEVLPPKKPELVPQRALSSPSQVSTGDAGRGNKEAYPRQVAKQPRLLEPSTSMTAQRYSLLSSHNRASTSEQSNALNLTTGQHQMSIVDRALTYPVYQTAADKQLEQGMVHLCCPFCQAVYKYRHWLAMHLQNIHGVKDKRALSEALTTSYAKSAANYYVAKTSIPSPTKPPAMVPTKIETVSRVVEKTKEEDKVIVISSEKQEAPPMPRPNNQMLDALGLMPKTTPSLEGPPVQLANSRKRKLLDVPGKKTSMPQDEDEGIGEMESDEHLKPLVLNMPLSVQATNLNTPFMYQRSVEYESAKKGKRKSPGRGRPPKRGSRSPGKLAELCDELAKRVESGKDTPKKSSGEGSSKDGSPEDCICNICGKQFQHKNQLWGHKKTHSKIYTCRSEKDGRETKTKSTRLGRRQNMPNFRDIANGKVPPLSEKLSAAAIPEKKRPRNTLGSTRGSKHKQVGKVVGVGAVSVGGSSEVCEKDKLLRKKKKKAAKKKRKALVKIITAYKQGPPKKKKVFLKEGNNAFYPRRFFYRFCYLRRQERYRRMLADLRQAVLLEIDADTKKNVYECLKCHRYHRYQRRCLQHYKDAHLSRKKKSPKRAVALPSKTSKPHQQGTDPKRLSFQAADMKPAKRGCHYCNTPGFNCSVHEGRNEAAQRFEVKTDENGRNFFSCLVCSKIFAFQSAILRHLNTHQVNQVKDVPCPSCDFIAKSPLSLAAHSRVHKKNPGLEDLKRSAAQQQHTFIKPKRVYKCDQCKLLFYRLDALRRHKITHRDYSTFKCSQCPACFKKPEDMYDHILQMHPTQNQYSCNKCSYGTSSYTTLLKHERGHDREENKTKALKSPLWKKDVANPPLGTSASSSDGNEEALDLRTASSKDRDSPTGDRCASPAKDKSSEAITPVKDQTSEANTPVKDKPSDVRKGGDSQEESTEKTSEKKVKDVEGVRNDEKEVVDGEKAKEKVNKVPTEAEIIESLSVKFEKVEVPSGSDEGWYYCTECNFTTNVQDSYLRHFKMHERAEMLTCEECQFPVLDQQGLEEHMLKAHHKNIKKLSCDLCQYVTSIPERMVRHTRLHKKMTLQCDQCGYRTPEKRFMIRHILTVHEQQRPFSCEKCNYATAYKHHLKRHYRLHKQQILQCPKCVHYTLDEKLMLHHIQSHKDDTPNVKCDVCSREFMNNKSLAIHKTRDHGKQNMSVEEAINHMTPGRQYRCEVSSLTTHTEMPLQLHTVSAQGLSEVYKCKKCTYKTSHQGNITLHMMREHLDDSEILMKIKDVRDVKQCAQCGFCTTKDQLDAHVRSHLEKDVYSCDSCVFKTSHAEALDRHTCRQDMVRAASVGSKEEPSSHSNDDKLMETSKEGQIQALNKEQSVKSQVNEVEVLDKAESNRQTETQDTMEKKKEDSEKETMDCGKDLEPDENRPAPVDNRSSKPDESKGTTDTPIMDQIPVIKAEPETDGIPLTQSTAPEVIQPMTSPSKQISENNNEIPEQVAGQSSGFACQVCEKMFATETLVKNHVKTDHARLVINAQNPFVCVLCPYSSCSEKEARRHLGLHNYDQQFKCEFCIFSTTTASSIATHRKVHRSSKRQSTLTSKRKNSCARVPATLIGNYASGILIDVGGSPKRRYPCKFCGDVFQVAEEWQHHERRHLMVWNMENATASEASK